MFALLATSMAGDVKKEKAVYYPELQLNSKPNIYRPTMGTLTTITMITPTPTMVMPITAMVMAITANNEVNHIYNNFCHSNNEFSSYDRISFQ